ncbi:MAG: hypothetical protein LBR31_04970 [Desulfovibrio sp.]|jgi:hypothetical protein|nr:hypothetical protein [Desulfovibrio sp.]
MSKGVSLLDRALEIAHREMSALETGDYDEASRLADQRDKIVEQAWAVLENEAGDQYRVRLVNLTQLQERLSALALSTRDMMRESLQRSRRERRRMQGYHQAVGHALRA